MAVHQPSLPGLSFISLAFPAVPAGLFSTAPDGALLVRYSNRANSLALHRVVSWLVRAPYSIILSAASRIVSTADVSLPGGRSLEVLNAATTAFPFAGLRYMNAKNPAWLPVWPIRVARP